jgi:hypothetical protein
LQACFIGGLSLVWALLLAAYMGLVDPFVPRYAVGHLEKHVLLVCYLEARGLKRVRSADC